MEGVETAPRDTIWGTRTLLKRLPVQHDWWQNNWGERGTAHADEVVEVELRGGRHASTFLSQTPSGFQRHTGDMKELIERDFSLFWWASGACMDWLCWGGGIRDSLPQMSHIAQFPQRHHHHHHQRPPPCRWGGEPRLYALFLLVMVACFQFHTCRFYRKPICCRASHLLMVPKGILESYPVCSADRVNKYKYLKIRHSQTLEDSSVSLLHIRKLCIFIYLFF